VGLVRLDVAQFEGPVFLAAGGGGTIVVGAETSEPSLPDRPGVGRLLADGRVDRSFAQGGRTVLAVPSNLRSLAVQADGKPLLTVELSGDAGRDVGLVRYSPAGTPVVAPRAWGWNPVGMVGNGTKVDSRVPVAPAGSANVRQFAAGWYHSVAVLDDGSVWTWGWNGLGQMAVDVPESTVPVRVAGIPPAVAVAAGAYHTLVLTVDGTLWAWGWNGLGQLGNGTTAPAGPVRVPIDDVATIAAGAGHSLAVKHDGTVWAWGWNATGQLGDGTATDRLLPTQVYGARDIIEVAAGALHTVALRSDRSVVAWGWNGVGQLGAGQAGDAWIPVPVAGLADVVSVAAGAYHSLAATRDGKAWAWGWNVVGQLGDGTTTNRFAPVAVAFPPGPAGVQAVAGGAYHSLALASDGTVWAWGWNGTGQLGDGTLTDRWAPVRTTRIVDATTVAGGAGHSLAG
jgi:alpha-tubulin suppressor-like RCC1 family protein